MIMWSGVHVLLELVVWSICSVLVSGQIWNENQIVSHLHNKPRAYFTHLFSKGGFRVGMEVGVADARFSELFLAQASNITKFEWHMVEPYPNGQFYSRYGDPSLSSEMVTGRKHIDKTLDWKNRKIGLNANIVYHKYFSSDAEFLSSISNLQFDFIYLDGAHDYDNVKGELRDIWRFVKPGGVLAGHDYCNYGEPSLSCKGCNHVPLCRAYTEYGLGHGKRGRGANQQGVVRAVQEWLMNSQPDLRLHRTVEKFSRQSLADDGFDYDVVITNTYNPSWFVIKPLV